LETTVNQTSAEQNKAVILEVLTTAFGLHRATTPEQRHLTSRIQVTERGSMTSAQWHQTVL
jgi:hypothetical protein